jgi:hypothetical protein
VESEATPLELFGGQAFVQRVDLRALRVALEREALVKPREKRVLEAAIVGGGHFVAKNCRRN